MSKVFNSESDRKLKNINVTKSVLSDINNLLLDIKIDDRYYVNVKRCFTKTEELISTATFNRKHFMTQFVTLVEYNKNGKEMNMLLEFSFENNLYYLCESIENCYPFLNIKINKSDVCELINQLLYF